MAAYKSPGTVVGVREGAPRIATPTGIGSAGGSIPGEGSAYEVEVVFDRGGRAESAWIPFGLYPIELGARVMVTIEFESK